MPRYAAFLRGVSPTNLKMPDLKRALEAAGFRDVKTILSSGNVAFDAPAASRAALERKAEAALRDRLGRAFPAFVRSTDELRALLVADPYRAFRLEPGAKRVVTFLRRRPKGSSCRSPRTAPTSWRRGATRSSAPTSRARGARCSWR